MGIFDFFSKDKDQVRSGVITTGKQKKDGGHDHRTNTGNDRTPAQRKGDKKRSK